MLGSVVEAEQRFDLAAQGLIARASLGEKRLALRLCAFQRRMIEFLDPPPQFRRCMIRPHRSPPRSARARARLSPIANRASPCRERPSTPDRKSTRLNSSHLGISYAVFC